MCKWIANNEWSSGSTIATSDSASLTILEKDLINWGVEHVGTSVDGTETTERLWESSKTIDWVEEWRVSILTHGLHVKNALFQ